jgi:hypothetical protein
MHPAGDDHFPGRTPVYISRAPFPLVLRATGVVELAITPGVQGIIGERDVIEKGEKIVNQLRSQSSYPDVHPIIPITVLGPSYKKPSTGNPADYF